MQIFKSKWFTRYAARSGIEDCDLVRIVESMERGSVDANLGGGVIKQRVARTGAGKSGGYRTILFYKKGELVFFIYGFSKKDRDNITGAELREFKKLAGIMLSMTQAQLERQEARGDLERIKTYEEKKGK